MFNSCEFIFDGESSLDYGLMIYDIGSRKNEDVSFGNNAEIVEKRINRRVTPLLYGVNYNKDPLQFRLIFGAEEPMDRHDLERIAMWLTGHQTYKTLTINQEDMEDYEYHVLITSLTPITVGGLPYAFEAQIQCDCPYAYGPLFRETYEISGSKNVIFMNDSSVRDYIRPQLTFTPSGASGMVTWRIVNHSDGDREFKIEGIPAVGSMVTVDCESGIISETTNHINLYGGYNMNMFRLVHGENDLTIYGSGTMVMSGRTLHNVSA